jgi:acyl carrier protein
MKVEELIANVMNVPLSLVTSATGPATLQAWSSLKHLELIEAIEEIYSVKLTTREIHTLTCVADIHCILQQRSVEAEDSIH